MGILHTNNSFEFENILKIVLNMYWSNIYCKTIPDIDTKHREAQKLINLFKRNDIEDNKIFERLTEILENMYNLINDEIIIKDIKSGKLKKQDFFRLYSEKIFGDNKREYNMRDLYSNNFIAKDKFNNLKSKVVFKKIKNDLICENEFKNSNGKSTRIFPLGDLIYEEFNGIVSNITKYRIQREINPGYFKEDIVYSSIIIPLMEIDEEYKKAVLEELLSENNIRLSNCNGYIGEIDKIPEKEQSNNVNGEKKTFNGYTYKVNAKYELFYDSAAVSAVVSYSLLDAEKEDKTNNDQNLIGEER